MSVMEQLDQITGNPHEVPVLYRNPATGQLENVGRVREVRRDIARIKTIQRNKLIAAAKG